MTRFCAPAAIERPASEAELTDIVVRAAGASASPCGGSGHSFTDCACTDGVMIDMTNLQRVTQRRQGERVGDRSRAAPGCIRSSPSWPRTGSAWRTRATSTQQSITGATATATHGTGARFKNVSAQIVSARVVTATGEVLEVSDGDDYLAARVSLGALGVISQVTLKVVPLFTLHREDELRPLTTTLERLDADVDGNDHFEFFVFPYGDTALTRTTRRSNEAPRPGPAWKKRLGEGFENTGLNVICRAGRQFPSAAPRLNRLLTSLMSPSSVQDHGWKVYASARNVKFTEMEYAIPREHAQVAVQRVIDLVRRRNLPIMYPLEVRFSEGGRAMLTDESGVFDFTGLPAGRYTVTVSKTGYISLEYGQRRPLQPGMPLEVGDGQQLRNVDFSLPKGGVIAGRLRGRSRRAGRGRIRARDALPLRAGRQEQLVPAGAAETDDRGEYRVWGLDPGDYYVNAVTRSRCSPASAVPADAAGGAVAAEARRRRRRPERRELRADLLPRRRVTERRPGADARRERGEGRRQLRPAAGPHRGPLGARHESGRRGDDQRLHQPRPEGTSGGGGRGGRGGFGRASPLASTRTGRSQSGTCRRGGTSSTPRATTPASRRTRCSR